MRKYFHDVVIAMESILANKLKSVLTALGIIFGVASVISMLAIGNGAQQEILEQIKMVGVNNILISPIVQETDDSGNEDNGGNGPQQRSKFSRGLTLLDAEAIETTIPSIVRMSPEIALNSHAVYGGKREPAKLIGVSSHYFELFNLPLESGTIFNERQEENGLAVCVIGANIKSRFFPDVNPVGKYIKFGHVWLQIIGVIERSNVSVSAFENVGINVYNDNIYIPTKTMLMRYQNRGILRREAAGSGVAIGGRGFMAVRSMISTNPGQNTSSNYHQLDKIVVQVHDTEQLAPTAELIGRMLLRRHSEVKDFEVTVPELLLKQQQRTREIFNVVLGAIASISLIVGGIGIMNIMFASVMERIKEIGTRQAIGATRIDIIVQFLSEAVLISVTGGLVGVILGIILSNLITHFADISTIVSFSSVLIAFFVSASVGVIFGYSPAKRAAERDPIESLRYE